MLKQRRKLFWFIIILTIVGFLVDLPTIPLNQEILGKRIESIRGPDIDLRPLGLQINKELKVHLGLDLQGGTQLILEADMSKIPTKDRIQALDGVVSILERRVDAFGVSEPRLQKSIDTTTQKYRVVVELPGIQNIEEAKSLIGKTAQLTFKEVKISEVSTTTGQTPAAPVVEYIETGLSGKDFKKAIPSTSSETMEPIIQFEIKAESADAFGALTKRLADNNQRLAIYLDEEKIFEGNVKSEIRTEGQIQGLDSIEKAKELAIQLNAGALPAPVSIIDERHVSATLGQDALKKSLLAGLIGIGVVILFMLYMYRWPGFVAIWALGVYAILTLAIFKLIPVVLTLAGIAGFILSIGVAVDANILIFERLKEELRAGRTIKTAVELGFNRAWPSIRDSNASTLITSAILFWFGSGAIKGFAVTLAIGVFVSLFTAISVTREFLHFFLETTFLKNKRLL